MKRGLGNLFLHRHPHYNTKLQFKISGRVYSNNNSVFFFHNAIDTLGKFRKKKTVKMQRQYY